MAWLLVLCVGFLVIIILLLAKISMMRKAAEEIRLQFSEKLENDTNTLIFLSTNDRAMRRLADDINVQLQELCRQRHRFVQGDMELKNAVTNISHDLRTPLTAVSGYLDLLERTEKSGTASRYLEVIQNRTEMLRELTEELFHYSVVTSPEYDEGLELLDVKGVLEESVLGFYAALKEQGITPDIHMPEGRVMRRLNRAALSRIFSNLLNNVRKYSGGDLEITLTESGEIIFSNLAPGLDGVQVERLFDRFFTVENAKKSTGLGLSISKTLVERMGGTISAGYENGRLRLEIRLPREDGGGKPGADWKYAG